MSITIHVYPHPPMLDSVQIFSPAEMLQSGLPTHWREDIRHTPVPDPDPEGIGFIPKTTIGFNDPHSGYHAYGDRNKIKYHRASLPRLLHGQNGKLIKNQGELDAALELLQNKAGEICDFNLLNFHFTRVNLVWHFRGDTADFILAHRHAHHVRLRM